MHDSESMRDEPGTQREYETIFILRPDTDQRRHRSRSTPASRGVIEQHGRQAPQARQLGQAQARLRGQEAAQGHLPLLAVPRHRRAWSRRSSATCACSTASSATTRSRSTRTSIPTPRPPTVDDETFDQGGRRPSADEEELVTGAAPRRRASRRRRRHRHRRSTTSSLRRRCDDEQPTDEGQGVEPWPCDMSTTTTSIARATAKARRQGQEGRRAQARLRAPQGLPLLRRQERRHRLQGPADAQVLHHRPRQDHPAPHQRQLRQAPAQGGARHQARAHDRAHAVHRHGEVEAMDKMQVILKDDVHNLGKSGELVDGQARATGATTSSRRASRSRRRAGNVAQIEHEKKHHRGAGTPSSRKDARGDRGPRSTASTVQHRAPGRRGGQALRLGHHARHRRGAGATRASRSTTGRSHLAEPIKTLGEFTVEVKVAREVSAQVKVTVAAKE